MKFPSIPKPHSLGQSGRLLVLMLASAMVLTACGGGGSNSSNTPSPPANGVLGGTVTGLAASDQITLQAGGQTLSGLSNGAFSFPAMADGSVTVMISSQPPSGETCMVVNPYAPLDPSGTFTVSQSSGTQIQINCAMYPAFIPALPQVGSYIAGATPIVNKSPRILPVYFADTPNIPSTNAFLSELLASSMWTNLAEYGVGPGTLMSPVQLSSNAPATVRDIDIVNLVTTNAKTWLPTLDATAYFVIFLPPTTTSTSGECGSGYHSAVSIGSVQVQYALVTGCGVERIALHEIMEGAADPDGQRGYAGFRTDKSLWTMMVGNRQDVEIGDMCEEEPLTVSDMPGYLIQPIWSNRAAAAGKNPCQPGIGSQGAYFGAVPTLNATLSGGGSAEQDHGVVIAPGASATIPVRIFSNMPLRTPISLSADVVGWFTYGTNSSTPAVIFSFDKTSANNGDTVNLTITMPSAPFPGLIIFEVKAYNNGATFSFPGSVANSATY